MDRSNNTHTNKSQGSDHGATSPKLIIQDTDFRIIAADAPVMLWLTDAEGKVPRGPPVLLGPRSCQRARHERSRTGDGDERQVAVLACVAVLIHEMPPRGMVHSAEHHMQR